MRSDSDAILMNCLMLPCLVCLCVSRVQCLSEQASEKARAVYTQYSHTVKLLYVYIVFIYKLFTLSFSLPIHNISVCVCFFRDDDDFVH